MHKTSALEDQTKLIRDYHLRNGDSIEMECVYAGWQGWREVRWPQRDAGSILFGRSLAAVGISDDDRLHRAAARGSGNRSGETSPTSVASGQSSPVGGGGDGGDQTAAVAISPHQSAESAARAALQASRDAAAAAGNAAAEVRAMLLGIPEFHFQSETKRDGTQPRGGFVTTPADHHSDSDSDDEDILVDQRLSLVA